MYSLYKKFLRVFIDKSKRRNEAFISASELERQVEDLNHQANEYVNSAKEDYKKWKNKFNNPIKSE